MWWGFALQDIEFNRVSLQDLSFTMASICFVFYYITFYTGTLFIGAMGMLQIILTLQARNQTPPQHDSQGRF